jgi:hypothetical protein
MEWAPTGDKIMENNNGIRSFRDFWPHYLRAHASPASRALHVAGVLGSLLLAAALVRSGLVFFLVLAIVPAQVGAWLGHKLSLRTADGHPEALDEHPEWSARADLKMFWLALTGRLGTEVARYEGPVTPSRPAWHMG